MEIVFEDEVLEEPTPKPVKQQSAPTDQRRDKAPAHETEAKSESSRQTSGEAEKTETINPAALFKPVVGNSSESVPEGNRLAPDGEKEQNKGEGAGYNLQGTDQLDAGLQGRGLREDYLSRAPTITRRVLLLCALRWIATVTLLMPRLTSAALPRQIPRCIA